jgi:hypothetical protein
MFLESIIDFPPGNLKSQPGTCDFPVRKFEKLTGESRIPNEESLHLLTALNKNIMIFYEKYHDVPGKRS